MVLDAFHSKVGLTVQTTRSAVWRLEVGQCAVLSHLHFIPAFNSGLTEFVFFFPENEKKKIVKKFNSWGKNQQR